MIEIVGDYTPTNGDKIREMNDLDLAEIIICPYDTEPDICGGLDCIKCCLEWLQEPAE